MSWIKRPSIWSVGSSNSASSASTSTSASSSAVQPSPLAAIAAIPDIFEEDEDDDMRPPLISIGDEQIDDAPFDPSIPDEVYFQMMQQAAAAGAASSPTSGGLHERITRLLGSQRHRHGPPSASIPPSGSGGSATSWRSKFKLRRDGSQEEPDQSPRQSLMHESAASPTHEPATVISCSKPPSSRMHLVPLAQAQTRDDIVHRPEGFEMAEGRSHTLAK